VAVADRTRAQGPLADGVHRVRTESDVARLIRMEPFDVSHDLRLHGIFKRRNQLAALRYVQALRAMLAPLVVTCGAGHFAEDVRQAGPWRRWLLRRAVQAMHHFWVKPQELLREVRRLGMPADRASYLSSALPLGQLPHVGELVTSQVRCVLRKPEAQADRTGPQREVCNG